MNLGDGLFHRPRTWAGLLIASIGIVLARLVSPAATPDELVSIIYVVGVLFALGGLALVASAIQVRSVRVVACPRCYLANSAEADRCARCDSPLGKEGQGSAASA
ncbi:MAG: hypothetical protein HY675_16860 [Chloroflexi bacterium]|nr:hypothetical protein [Chloroflexota bacterium]